MITSDTQRLAAELFDAIEHDDERVSKRVAAVLLGNFLDDVRRLADAAQRIARAMEELT